MEGRKVEGGRGGREWEERRVVGHDLRQWVMLSYQVHMGMEFVLPLLLCSHTHAHTHMHTYTYVHVHAYAYTYTYTTHAYTTHVQGSFWKYLSRPTSEKFFHEIHNHFQEAQTEIKNCPMGLVIEQQGDSTRMVVSQPSAENSGGAGPKKLSRSKLVSQLSMEQRAATCGRSDSYRVG